MCTRLFVIQSLVLNEALFTCVYTRKANPDVDVVVVVIVFFFVVIVVFVGVVV